MFHLSRALSSPVNLYLSLFDSSPLSLSSMADEKPQQRWEGKSKAELRSSTAAQVWPLLADDFCSLHKLLPGFIDTCRWVEGAPGQPGLTRHCANSSVSSWANERLIAIDPQEMYFTYEVTENNVGFRSYQATIRVSPSVEEGTAASKTLTR